MTGSDPRLFPGDPQPRAHIPWIDARVQPEYLVLREMDAAGNAGEPALDSLAKKNAPALHALPEPRSGRRTVKGVTWTFSLSEPMPLSESVRGLQFAKSKDSRTKRPTTTCPPSRASQSLVGREGGFRSQYAPARIQGSLWLGPPPGASVPMVGGPYAIRSIVLRVVTARPASLRFA